MKKTKLFLATAMIAILSFFAISCNNDDAPTQKTSSISIKLIDKPGDFDNVFIDVQAIQLKVNEDETINVTTNGGIYDLLELTGGISALLVDETEIPSGVLKEIRLILGEDNTVVKDGVTQPLRTPSAQQSGLKIKINQELLEGVTYNFILDFSVRESVVVAGNSGNINLKPVIRASLEALTGSLEGDVTPTDIAVEALLTKDTDTISTVTNEGKFKFYALDEGSYELTLIPEALDTVRTQVSIIKGEITKIPTINLE